MAVKETVRTAKLRLMSPRKEEYEALQLQSTRPSNVLLECKELKFHSPSKAMAPQIINVFLPAYSNTPLIIIRITKHCHSCVILGCCTQKCNTTDINILHSLFYCYSISRYGLHKGIQVAHHHSGNMARFMYVYLSTRQ